MPRLLEIRSYVLKQGGAAQFHTLVSECSVPLLRQRGVDVVRFGPSSHDSRSYFLIRAFHDQEQLTTSLAKFYGSEVWKAGPRAAIIELIEYDTTTLMWLAPEAIEALRGR